MSMSYDNYILTRDASEAERLELQHRYMMSCQGYYVHPDIKIPSDNARIAELATGTGIWMRELALANPDVEFYGFDISGAMFPKQFLLPSNIHFHTADVKKPFENRRQHFFDMVHIRLLQAAVTKNDWAHVLRNVVTLLKPGGWLQWFEDDRAVAVRHALQPVAPPNTAEVSLRLAKRQSDWQVPHTGELARFNKFIMPDDRAIAMNHGYMNLDTLMLDPDVGNLEHVSCDGFVIDRADDNGELRRGWAVMGISAAWHMIKMKRDMAAELTEAERNEWTERALEEIEKGSCYISRAVVFIGRKRLLS